MTALTGSGPATFEYDAADRLVAVVKGTQRSEFSYNAFHHLVKIVEKVSGVIQRTKDLIWCRERICEERDSVSGTRRFYEDGFTAGASVYYYTKDHLGSIRDVLDASGFIISSFVYDPYGRVAPYPGTAPSIFPSFGFTGLYSHLPSGLSFATYRAYVPDLARWINRDPIGERGGMNLYGYVLESPVMNVDPSGLEVKVCRRVTRIPGGRFVGATHVWLVTDECRQGVGMGTVPGVAERPFAPVQNRYQDEGQDEDPSKICESQPNVEEECVNSFCRQSIYLGRWLYPVNYCHTFVNDVVQRCQR